MFTVDVDGPGPKAVTNVYCEMTFAGGGWTFIGHLDGAAPATAILGGDVGAYRTDRADDGTTYGLGGLISALGHGETLAVLDEADPLAASSKKKLGLFAHPTSGSAFHSGPLPCKGGFSGVTVRTSAGGAAATVDPASWCDAYHWYPKNLGGAFVVLHDFEGNGSFWGAAIGGSDTWGHDSWWYVR